MASLKVGELAKRSGLTVRTLHHYDEIGLLKPSGRSDSGYRLYDRADVERLHAIQALRRLGLALDDIGGLLSGDGASLPAIVERQLRALEEEIAQATELRSRLVLLQGAMASGHSPEMNDWLDTLSLMSTYGKYFGADELKGILDNLKRTEAEWKPLAAAVRAEMDRGTPAEAMQIQPLAREWMDLAMRWMDNDMDRLTRWGRMYRTEATARGRHGIDLDVIDYIGRAIELRLAAFHKYLTPEEIGRLDKTLGPEWKQLAHEVRELLRQGTPPDSPEARALAGRWDQLFDRMVRHDPVLRAKLITAHQNEPVIQQSAPLGPEERGFIMRAMETLRSTRLDPHAT
jgi:DNA-binding transcriptional MerR regulator